MEKTTKQRIFADLILLFVAMIWGTAFIFQREGVSIANPFLFNAYRYFLGALVLLPLLLIKKTKISKDAVFTGITLGVILFVASALQQAGMAYTSASKAGFITSLYVILVPVLSLILFRENQHYRAWLIALFAIFGLYLVSISNNFSVNMGDMLIFVCSFFWAGHVLFVSKRCGLFDSLLIAFLQFFTASLLSYVTSGLFYGEFQIPFSMENLQPLLYTGILSTAVAFSLQIVAQKHAPPTDAAVIMSSESLFAALAGFLFLGEVLTVRQYVGCAIILLSILLIQLPKPTIRRKGHL